MSNRFTYHINPRGVDIGGGFQLKLMDGEQEVGGGAFPVTADTTSDEAYLQALDAGEEWLQSRGQAADPAPSAALTDEQIIAALHANGIDTYPSKYGFDAVQVSATSVPNLRNVLASLGAAPSQVAQTGIEPPPLPKNSIAALLLEAASNRNYEWTDYASWMKDGSDTIHALTQWAERAQAQLARHGAAGAAQVAQGKPVLIQALETGDDRESSRWFDIQPAEVAMYTEEGYKIRKLYDLAAPVAPSQKQTTEPVARVERLIGVNGLAEVIVFKESALKVGTLFYAHQASAQEGSEA